MRIGVLTGGGDCPGLNAVIRAIVRRGLVEESDSFIGFRNGWAGVRDDDTFELDLESTRGILARGGTILGTSRTDPMADGAAGIEVLRETLRKHGVQGMAVIGGDGTLRGARDAYRAGIPLLGIPKTIDNDVGGTDLSVGFQTAAQTATDAIDRLHTTAESHNRVIVVEVMGRHAGWIATYAGMAGGADAIIVPERPFEIDRVCHHLHRRHERGRTFSIVVVAEGAQLSDSEGAESPAVPWAESRRLGGVGTELAQQIEARTGYESRVTILGHVQRGGTPIVADRILATRFGVAAAAAASNGHFGVMIALHGNEIVEVDLAVALAEPKRPDTSLYETAELFFG